MENVAGLRCPNCATVVYPSPGVTPICPSCGFTDRAPPTWNIQATRSPAPATPASSWGDHTPSQATPVYDPRYAQPYTPPYGTPKAPPTQGIAIVALILNIVIWPGLGSLIGGRQVGWAQGFIFLLGIPLTLAIIGIPMLIGAWIWGIVTGVELINEASRAQQNPLPPPA